MQSQTYLFILEIVYRIERAKEGITQDVHVVRGIEAALDTKDTEPREI